MKILKCVYIEMPGEEKYRFLITDNPIDGMGHLHVSPVRGGKLFDPYLFERDKIRQIIKEGIDDLFIGYVEHKCNCDVELAQKITEALMEAEGVIR